MLSFSKVLTNELWLMDSRLFFSFHAFPFKSAKKCALVDKFKVSSSKMLKHELWLMDSRLLFSFHAILFKSAHK